MVYQRDLNARERMRLFFPNINVVMIAEIQGKLIKARLTSALEKIRNVHPLAGVKVIVDESGHGRFSSEGVDKIPLGFKVYKDDKDLEITIREELGVKWNFDQGPLLRVTVLSSGNDHYLVFCAHHIICDGRSFVTLIRDLLNIYENQKNELIEFHEPVSVDDRLPSGIKPSGIGKLIIDRMNKQWSTKNGQFNQKDYEAMHASFWLNRKASILVKRIDIKDFEPFIRTCRNQGCTLNSAIYTAFLLAQMNVQGYIDDKVIVPIDLCGYLNPPLSDVFGYYASALVIKNPIKKNQNGFWDLARKFDKTVRKMQNPRSIFEFVNTSLFDPNLLDAAIFALNGMVKDPQAVSLADRMFNKLSTKLMVSNLGRLDIKQEFGDIELVNITPPILVSGNTEKVVEMLTIGNRMNFSITHDPEKVSKEVVEEIFNCVRNTILLGSN